MFAFRLCLALGFPHPDVLLACITSRQLGEWMAFYSIEPWGEMRAEQRNALLASMIAAGQGKSIPMQDLMLYSPEAQAQREAAERARVQEMRAWFERQATTGDK